MQQDVDAWEREIAVAARAFTFVRTIQTLDKNPAALKVRLLLGPEFFVQIYINVDTDVQNLVLVLGRQRLYARDCVGGAWHRHPHDNPDAHDFSPTGANPVTVADFLGEVQELVEQMDLL